jgi:hypothetical protein
VAGFFILEKQQMTDDAMDVPLWGAREIARVLNVKPRKAFYLLEYKLVDGTKIGSQWVSTRRRLLRSIAGDEATS